MKDKELRIGNYVMQDGEEIHGIVSLTIHKYSIGQIKLDPIALTEDWLVKFGFNKLPIVFEHGKFYLYKEQNSNLWRLTHSGTNAHITTLKYVHELQNIYYDLTKIEINYK